MAKVPGGPSVSVGGVWVTQQGKPDKMTTVPLEEGGPANQRAACAKSPGQIKLCIPRPPASVPIMSCNCWRRGSMDVATVDDAMIVWRRRSCRIQRARGGCNRVVVRLVQPNNKADGTRRIQKKDRRMGWFFGNVWLTHGELFGCRLEVLLFGFCEHPHDDVVVFHSPKRMEVIPPNELLQRFPASLLSLGATEKHGETPGTGLGFDRENTPTNDCHRQRPPIQRALIKNRRIIECFSTHHHHLPNSFLLSCRNTKLHTSCRS